MDEKSKKVLNCSSAAQVITTLIADLKHVGSDGRIWIMGRRNNSIIQGCSEISLCQMKEKKRDLPCHLSSAAACENLYGIAFHVMHCDNLKEGCLT